MSVSCVQSFYTLRILLRRRKGEERLRGRRSAREELLGRVGAAQPAAAVREPAGGRLRLVALGHRLADELVEADERHYSTDFTFVLVAPEIPDSVADYVDGFRDRTLLTYGYFGLYEVNLVVVSPTDEELVASEQADVAAAFRTWAPPPARDRGVFGRLADAIFE